ncbi:hypothetical protein TNCT_688361 [Trichonephila clavata]|uniref:Uncharacterized protein n=1 Tax=Trichonephila clavata TaxID=2740835 RepID=A0A8X6HF26_TRICU|nr:hypothetical protein TNCT_688361 [Trichonephila clavata]
MSIEMNFNSGTGQAKFQKHKAKSQQDILCEYPRESCSKPPASQIKRKCEGISGNFGSDCGTSFSQFQFVGIPSAFLTNGTIFESKLILKN